jgi:hypothetical protein
MLMENLFSSGVMRMGPSRNDPTRQVGVFNPEAVSGLPALRAARMEEVRWIAGEWSYENAVPATAANPAYSDVGTCRYALCEKNNWICTVAADGKEVQFITFDPFGKQWIYVLMNGAYGMLRSPDGWRDNQIVFAGLMTMIGLNCEWRIRWTKENHDRFSFVNEERDAKGAWRYIDEWRFTRKAG